MVTEWRGRTLAHYAVAIIATMPHYKEEGPVNAPLGAEMKLCRALVLTMYQTKRAISKY